MREYLPLAALASQVSLNRQPAVKYQLLDLFLPLLHHLRIQALMMTMTTTMTAMTTTKPKVNAHMKRKRRKLCKTK